MKELMHLVTVEGMRLDSDFIIYGQVIYGQTPAHVPINN